MLLKPLISAEIQPKMMVGGRFMQGSPKTELEVLLQNPGLPKILVQRDGDVQIWFKNQACATMGALEGILGKPGHKLLNLGHNPVEVMRRPRLTNRMPEKNYMAPQPVTGSTPSRGFEDGQKDKSVSEAYEDDADENYDDDIDDKSDAVDDPDDELLSDDFDSDTSQKSHETRKKSRWFSKFFESLDSLTVEEINEPARQWHCPACQCGPAATDWYHGLQPLLTHAKTKGSRRIKLRRELAELLEEELHGRGTSPYELFGKWKGLKDEDKDHDIIWPPMVVILNTKLEKDENDKWIGMGNQELLAYFNSFAAVKARHSYGPQGHPGISVLIFENSAGGYLEAERLHEHFSEQGTDREAWNYRQVLFLPGGKRQLYGFMALKEDLDFFNQHSQGKSKLKFELRSYQEMVVKQIRQMSEDNQQLGYFKNIVDKAQRHSKSLEASFSIMDFQEQFFKDQIKIIHGARDLKEEDFEMVQQQEREKVKQSIENPSNTEDYTKRVERMADFIKFQDEEMEEFVEERDQKIKVHEDKESTMRRRHLEAELELEKEFDAELSSLMEKYSFISQKLLPPRTGREICILN
ncbi:hypothetical protein Patl1_14907 [Pistacia atlantica]|uniref:Uncharacterized protein n=1 Tax=Pistacia atlantica TaxID=434234 RepID=A0ACC1AXK5_9ROSI|nr:hypothetical protein Patl1_14907 [Pistacia atlantica]